MAYFALREPIQWYGGGQGWSGVVWIWVTKIGVVILEVIMMTWWNVDMSTCHHVISGSGSAQLWTDLSGPDQYRICSSLHTVIFGLIINPVLPVPARTDFRGSILECSIFRGSTWKICDVTFFRIFREFHFLSDFEKSKSKNLSVKILDQIRKST